MDEIKRPEPLAKYIKESKYRVFLPFVVFNYPFRWLTYFLDKVAFLKLLEYISLLSIIVGVYFYYAERDDRQKAKHYQAWQVINLAQGKPGNGGRTDALLDLYNDGVSLANIDLSHATLPGISLKNADLVQANFLGANLEDASLLGADLRGANLSGANFNRANLTGAQLSNAENVGWGKDSFSKSKAQLSAANLSGAKFHQANLCEADLGLANLSEAQFWSANLSEAQFWSANLSGAELNGAKLSGAQLWNANLSRAMLSGTDLTGADLSESDVNGIKMWRDFVDINNANIYGIRNAPEGFIEWAKEHGAISENRNTGDIFFKLGVQRNRNKFDDLLNTGVSLAKRAKLKSDEKLFEEASIKFEQANKLKPNDYLLYTNWGACFSEWAILKGSENLFERSYQKYKTAVKINPNGFEAYGNWSTTLMSEAKFKAGTPKYESLLRQAEEKCLKAESLRKGSSAYNLACIYALRGDKEKCKKWLLAGQETNTLVTRDKAIKDNDLDNVKNEPWFKEIKWNEGVK